MNKEEMADELLEDVDIAPCNFTEQGHIMLHDNAHALVLRYINTDDGDGRISGFVVANSQTDTEMDKFVVELLQVLLYIVQHKPEIVVEAQLEALMQNPVGNA